MTDRKPDLGAAYALQGRDDNLKLYADWAESYDSDFAQDMDYRLPALVADAFARIGRGPVLDLGAGTGLCGLALARQGIGPVDGTDLSTEMLQQAEAKGVYRRCFTGDLLGRLPVGDGAYAGAVSSGTFTHGHVGPEALTEVLRVVAPGGWVVLSINAAHYAAHGFEATLATLPITDLTLPEQAIYGPGGSSEHRDDTAFLATFRKA
ncbi:class I SAM-dependent methyltransferase [Mesobacterium sp. TK19101]|uniref:Class I SAM-dependent methyltransferase n=1 Tax=Mesobacterium hydrothermale TaxID=3111907 RepID=A0ABU6HKA5_9RHOB|nr:class I SAM-dependent methyltransferase [Mesobacterium sp. TK19101]MEC3862890.1 class I SAM-dependent methyltransferase [Mesobacterium sp. TK19101]